MSSINPNNINGSYPIAGQDNDSQGFRDNFTNVKNNLTFAKTEIEDLQTNAILKTALAGTTLNNEMNNAQIKGAQLLRTVETIKDLGTQTTSVAINFADGHYQKVTTNGALIISAFTGWPTSQLYAKLRLEIVISTSGTDTVTFQTVAGVTWVGLTNIQGAVGQTITFPAAGSYVFEFTTYNAGTTITIDDLTRNKDNIAGNFTITDGALMLASSEDLAASGAASLVKTASYFTTSTAETATLAAGTDGQIKTFSMVADGGDMVITVTNAGWKSSGTGTITFDTIGDSCTLQYIASKWFCIGNNGVTFA